MGTLSEIKFNPAIRIFHKRLIETGKVKKLAITACMRKLLTILNTMIKNKTPWIEIASSKRIQLTSNAVAWIPPTQRIPGAGIHQEIIIATQPFRKNDLRGRNGGKG